MIHNSRLRILSDHPVRDLAGICAERAEKRIEGAKKRFWRCATPKLERICGGLLYLSGAEEMLESGAFALKERGLDKFAFLLGRALNAEGIAEEAVTKFVEAHVAKARAIGGILFFWKLAREMEDSKREPNFLDEEGLPKPPREGGVVFQDASCWYDRCGSPRYYAVSGRGAVSIFDSELRKPG